MKGVFDADGGDGGHDRPEARETFLPNPQFYHQDWLAAVFRISYIPLSIIKDRIPTSQGDRRAKCHEIYKRSSNVIQLPWKVLHRKY